MTSKKNIVIAFDLYGTLLSIESIAKELATHFGDEKAGSIAALWRRYQLEYTWRMNSMGLYKPFSDITRTSLQHALAEHSVTLSSTNITNLMKAYDSLGTFPDVEPGLKAVSSDPSISAYVFSNGTDAMVSSSVNQSPSLSPQSSVFKGLITVQEVELFKPHPKVYYHLAEEVGKTKEEMGSIWLVSGNPFDVVGARAVGMQAAWVDRAEKGWSDRLGELASGGPTLVVSGVEDAVRKIKNWTEKKGEQSGAGLNKEEAAMGPG
ncbi:related to 2-haloalkanoic acid dehalogenase [Phialocephala subalpina]|uniref:Related to 2-haloalkanoic acid dehalogenase n=1 Tax=Phialocephala subalpina TaxID=576137 RepID=A0A1L7WXJ9_9HELO|nr:related to 2-haloalkanoic acid dehalogenase [Phialocephala subalpina]